MVQSQVLDRTFSALSDPTRRDILDVLARGPASISELAEPIGISLPGVLKHVRVLEEAKLVTTSKQGRRRECRLAPGDMEEVTDWIDHYRRLWERRLDRLEAYVERQQRKGDGR
jgi:DNA-binding transcriptional ArsR family regulator